MYIFVGYLIGISLRTKHLLPFEFCPQIWKTIVGDVVTEEDLFFFTLNIENTEQIAKDILKQAMENGSTDNMSCIVIKL